MKEFLKKLESSQPRRIIYRLLIALGIAVLLFAVMNNQYLWKQLKYRVSGSPAAFPSNTNTAPRGEPNLLKIPSLGITAPVQYAAEANENAFQVALINGVVHYPGTANPGEFGNAYIFGHSSDLAFSKGKFKTVFALLPQIENGAEIQVSNADGQIFTYVVTDQFVASKTDVHLLDQGDRTHKQLTLQTSYPLGTALKRYIVIAQLKE